MSYQERFNARLYEPSRCVWAHRRLPECVRMWSPWWLRHVVAVERTGHARTMDELRRAEDGAVVLGGPESAVEAVAEALCAWPSVAVDDRSHGTATYMAIDALRAAMDPALGDERLVVAGDVVPKAEAMIPWPELVRVRRWLAERGFPYSTETGTYWKGDDETDLSGALTWLVGEAYTEGRAEAERKLAAAERAREEAEKALKRIVDADDALWRSRGNPVQSFARSEAIAAARSALTRSQSPASEEVEMNPQRKERP